MPFPHIFKGRTPPRPDFPNVADLPNLAPADAERALSALRVLVERELVEVYTSAGSNDREWQCWLNLTWRRVPLPEWAADWIATWHANPSTDGPDGPEAA